MTYYLKNTSGSTVSIIDLGIVLPDDTSKMFDSNERNGYLTADMTTAINSGDIVLSTTDIGNTGGDMSITEAINALTIPSKFDTDNPHAVTFTQAVTADSLTDITGAEAETLTDGSNADTLHEHDADNITYDNTSSALTATDVQSAIDEIDSTLDNLLPKGTSFPGSPSDGDLFYRTDLNTTFQYDGSRSKWLSITQMFLDWGSNNADGKYLTIHGATATQTGYLMPKAGTILNVTARCASGNLTKGLEIRRNNSATPLKSFSLTAGSYSTINDNINFAAGDYLQVFANSSGTAAIDIVVMVTMSWTSI